MISYVECLNGGEGAGPSVTSRCWNAGPDEERDELLPRKMAALQPKTEGSLRRRLLSSRIHKQQDAMLALNRGAGRPGMTSSSCDLKPLPSNSQYPGNSPWYRRPPVPGLHTYPTKLEAHSKPFFTSEYFGKPHTPSVSVLTQRRRTSSSPPRLEPRPCYADPALDTFKHAALFTEPEVPPQYCYRPNRGRKRAKFFSLRWRRGKRNGWTDATQTTPLLNRAGDRDSKWAVHYNTQTPQQGLVFIPGKRRAGSADNIQACNGPSQHGYNFNQSPCSSERESSTRKRWRDKSRKMSSTCSDDEERFILTNTRPLTPLVLNPVPHWELLSPAPEQAPDLGRDASGRLPTPEERMRQHAGQIAADIVPINITGASFDRQASLRKSAPNSDSLSRRPRNQGRRQTVTGLPDDVIQTTDSASLGLPGQFSTVDRPKSSSVRLRKESKMADLEPENEVGVKGEAPSSSRRIRAPRGEGMSSLMASLTSPLPGASNSTHSLPRTPTNSSINSELSCTSAPYSTLSASSSYCQSQDLQGSSSDLQSLLPFDQTARAMPQSPSTQSQWSYPGDRHLNEATHPPPSHYLSSSSIADSESQFSYQTSTNDGGSFDGDTWSYRTLSPSSSNPTPDLRSISGEGFSYDPLVLLSSGRSTPANTDSISLCSGKTSPNRLDRRKLSSISLRKSKRPPAPPMRSDSLRRRPGRSKPSRCYSSPRMQRSPRVDRKSPTSSPQAFHDPWVPRRDSNTEREKGIICGTVASFEPLTPNSVDNLFSEENVPPESPSLSNAHIRNNATESQSTFYSGEDTNLGHLSPISVQHFSCEEHLQQSPGIYNTPQFFTAGSHEGSYASPAASPAKQKISYIPKLTNAENFQHNEQQKDLDLDMYATLANNQVRNNTTECQTQITYGTVPSYEPLSPISQYSRYLPQSPCLSNGPKITPGSPDSDSESLRFSHNPKNSTTSSYSSMAGLECLASPSSSYSGLSNTPIPGYTESQSKIHYGNVPNFEPTSPNFVDNSSSVDHLPPSPGMSDNAHVRYNTTEIQTNIHYGMVTNFEPLSPNFIDNSSSERLPVSPGFSNAPLLTPGSPDSELEGLRYSLNTQPSSMARLERLASPSSGYSSQSNTPTPGTPLSSPLSPSSPLAAFPPFSALADSNLNSSMPRLRSRVGVDGRPKPPVPERKSSLMSSVSSSFSSNSSLSSCTSIESSTAKHLPLPLPPPPPPPPPPLPPSRLPPPPYSHAVKTTHNLPLHPTLAIPPKSPKGNVKAPPLVTTQALQNLKLRPVKKQGGLLTSIKLTNATSTETQVYNQVDKSSATANAAAIQDSHSKQDSAGEVVGSQNAVCGQASMTTALMGNANLQSPVKANVTLDSYIANYAAIQDSPSKQNRAVLFDGNLEGQGNTAGEVVGSQNAACGLPNVTAAALMGDANLHSPVKANVTLHSYVANYAAIHDPPGKQDSAVLSKANLDSQANPDAMLRPQNAVFELCSNEANITTASLMDNASRRSPLKAHTVQPGCKSGCDYYNLTRGDVGSTKHLQQSPGPSITPQVFTLGSPKSNSHESSNANPAASPAKQKSYGPELTNASEDFQYNQQQMEDSDMYATLANNQVSTPDCPWVKMAYGSGVYKMIQQQSLLQQQQQQPVENAKLTKTAETQGDSEDVLNSNSSYWSLSGTKQDRQSEKKDDTSDKKDLESLADGESTANSDFKQNSKVFKTGSPKKVQSPVKPVPPKKPDLCILAGMASPEAKRGLGGGWNKSGGQIPTTNQTSQIESDWAVNVNTTPTLSPVGSPQRQKPPILHKKPDLLIASPIRSKPVFRSITEPQKGTSEIQDSSSALNGNRGTVENRGSSGMWDTFDNDSTSGATRVAENCTVKNAPNLENGGVSGTRGTTSDNTDNSRSLKATRGTLDNHGTAVISDTFVNGSTLDKMGIVGVICSAETPTVKVTPNTMDHLENFGVSGTRGTTSDNTDNSRSLNATEGTLENRVNLESSEDHHTGFKDPCSPGVNGTSPYKDIEQVSHSGITKAPFKEEENESTLVITTTQQKDNARKKHKNRRSGRQLLMMSLSKRPAHYSTTSSSSSSSSSSGDESDVATEKIMQTWEESRKTKVCVEDTSDSEDPCGHLGQSRYSLNSALSTDSLQGALSLPDLLIQEEEEEEEERDKEGRRWETGEETKENPDADLFVTVSAEQMLVSGRQRTTEDLFAVIHRSKRKMFGRKNSEEVTNTNSFARPSRHGNSRGPKSSQSASFKALLLRKGTRAEASSRISAVERLCVVPTAKTTNVPPLKFKSQSQPNQCQVEPTTQSDIYNANTHFSVDVPVSPTSLYSQSYFLMLRRNFAAPCFSSRRFGARGRFYAAPMDAILERESEEEADDDNDDDDVFMESAGVDGESSRRLDEIF